MRLGLLAVLGAAFFVSGCTVMDASTLRTLTIDDGARYIQENHQWRREIRRERYALVRKIVTLLDAQATARAAVGDYQTANGLWSQADAVLRGAYPDLATIEALKNGVRDFGELRALVLELRDE